MTYNLLENEGFHRQSSYYLRYYRSLDKPISSPTLPSGFLVRSVRGASEVAERAALHSDSFYPYTSKTYDEATIRYIATMQMPEYDPDFDLVVTASDGTLAAGCICWLDTHNNVGLFEPVGTRTQFRRRGLATALMLEGLHRMRERGMRMALVTARHPGEEGKDTFPEEFTSSRFVYEAAGFHLLRRTYIYSKIAGSSGLGL